MLSTPQGEPVADDDLVLLVPGYSADNEGHVTSGAIYMGRTPADVTAHYQGQTYRLTPEGGDPMPTTAAERLTEAFHLVYDVKDEAICTSIRYAAYEAVQAIEKLMELTAVEVPRRFDGDGRGHGLTAEQVAAVEAMNAAFQAVKEAKK